MATYTNETKNATTYTNQTKNNVNSFLLQENLFFILLETGEKIILEGLGVGYVNEFKH